MTDMSDEEKKIHARAKKLDESSKELRELRATCKHRWVGSWSGCDVCAICGEEGAPDR